MPKAARDPFGVPTYSEDLARRPKLTFAQLSDSQFDDGTVPRYKARYAYDEVMNTLAVKQVNRLKPAMVFMTGDLTNKNTEAEWKTFGRIYGALEPPLHAMPGNHDGVWRQRAQLGVAHHSWAFEKIQGRRVPFRAPSQLRLPHARRRDAHPLRLPLLGRVLRVSNIPCLRRPHHRLLETHLPRRRKPPAIRARGVPGATVWEMNNFQGAINSPW